VTCMGF